MMEAHADAGPLLDVILYREKSGGYFDGSLFVGGPTTLVWRAVVDTSGVGDLSNATPMAPFRVERQVR